MKRLAKILAPYLAVVVFFCRLRSAWLAILAYHLQILLWSRGGLGRVLEGWDGRRFLALGLPCLLAGPLAYWLLPWMLSDETLGGWFAAYGIPRWSLVLLVPYFGLVHPVLEQAHWGPLRQERRGAWLVHFAFAGYHILVLQSLLRWEWVPAVFLLLLGVSLVWTRVQREAGGLAVPAASHVLADLGIVVAALLRTR